MPTVARARQLAAGLAVPARGGADPVPQARSRAPGAIRWAVAAGAAFLAAACAALLLWPEAPPTAPPQPAIATPAPAPAQPSPAAEAAPVAAPRPAPPESLPGPTVAVLPVPAPARPAEVPAPRLASEAELVATLPVAPTMLRLRENPRVFVLLFPDLDSQGAALNRMAALVEKAGLPRDRLLGDEELARAIQKAGDTPATWYLGHDYPGAEIARFFALAERDGTVLNPAELWVRDRWREARALVPDGTEIALISTGNPDARMDPLMRAAILRHEIGHGHFFTLPELRAHVMRVWRERFRERDRQAFRAFLGREGYDASNETLMANETMAYLVFTPDPRFFSARLVGMTEAEVARLREAMRDGLPVP